MSDPVEHYENLPMLLCNIQRFFSGVKIENVSRKKKDIFNIFAQNTDWEYKLEPPHQGHSNQYPQSMFWNKNKKKMVYPCKPQFYYIKVGYEEYTLHGHVIEMKPIERL